MKTLGREIAATVTRGAVRCSAWLGVADFGNWPCCLMEFWATALLLPVSLLVAWKCWKLPPVPVIRIWGLILVVMMCSLLALLWGVRYWQREAARLRLELRQLSPQSPQQSSNGGSARQESLPIGAVPGPPRREVRERPLTAREWLERSQRYTASGLGNGLLQQASPSSAERHQQTQP